MEDDKEKTVIDTIKLIEDLAEQLRQCSRLVDDAEMRRVLAEAEVFLTSAPHPEAREEDIEAILYALYQAGLRQGKWLVQNTGPNSPVPMQPSVDISIYEAMDALARLAAPKPEGQDASTARDILRNWLKGNGYAGLAGNDCGCGLDDLAPCGCDPLGCVPADLHKCDVDNGQTCEYEQDCNGLGCYRPRTPSAPEPRPAEEPVGIPPKALDQLVRDVDAVRHPERESAPAPSEEDMAAPDGFVKRLLRMELQDRDYIMSMSVTIASLRSKLARKDEGLLAEVARARENITRSQIDEDDWWDGYAAALDDVYNDALRGPDGRKGE